MHHDKAINLQIYLGKDYSFNKKSEIRKNILKDSIRIIEQEFNYKLSISNIKTLIRSLYIVELEIKDKIITKNPEEFIIEIQRIYRTINNYIKKYKTAHIIPIFIVDEIEYSKADNYKTKSINTNIAIITNIIELLSIKYKTNGIKAIHPLPAIIEIISKIDSDVTFLKYIIYHPKSLFKIISYKIKTLLYFINPSNYKIS